MNPDNHCKDCLYYYPQYQYRYKEGEHICTFKNREVNPEAVGCSDFVLPVIPRSAVHGDR